jgi:predicted negative regulator of RcsB-dependent stress response
MITTNGLTSWASDLKDIGAIYPFQGSELLLVVLGLVFWVGWHVIQNRQETETIEAELRADPRGDKTRAAIDRYY